MFYRVIRAAFRALAALLFSFRVEGAQHLPTSGPVVVVAPHRSWLDPACVGAAARRPVRFLILDRVYEKRWARWFYRRMGSVPVRPGGRAALRTALRLLERGEVVGVFPEGRVVRARETARVHPGAALLAVRSGAPVVPMAITGSERAWPPGRRWPRPARVRVRVAAAIDPGAAGERMSVEEMLGRIEATLRGAPLAESGNPSAGVGAEAP